MSRPIEHLDRATEELRAFLHDGQALTHEELYEAGHLFWALTERLRQVVVRAARDAGALEGASLYDDAGNDPYRRLAAARACLDQLRGALLTGQDAAHRYQSEYGHIGTRGGDRS